MIVLRTKQDLGDHLEKYRLENQSIGFVPTMGALHPGHISLVRRASAENERTVVSIFVNPTQFNDPGDLEKYPRTLDEDLLALQAVNTDVVFVPSVKEMYPEPDERTFDLGGLDRVMEGRQRKGHFNGVAQIVTRLFEAVPAHRAYFGQKDFQQLVIVRHLVRQLGLPLEIVACPIVREADGLAMSSRNVRLDKKARDAAPFIYASLLEAREQARNMAPDDLISWMEQRFKTRPEFTLEYFEIVDDKFLRAIGDWKEPVNKVACIAVQLNGIRLIDNLFFD
ncbi:MAG: pantoate--beta-alanine ligase [Bacteroidales bacterium]